MYAASENKENMKPNSKRTVASLAAGKNETRRSKRGGLAQRPRPPPPPLTIDLTQAVQDLRDLQAEVAAYEVVDGNNTAAAAEMNVFDIDFESLMRFDETVDADAAVATDAIVETPRTHRRPAKQKKEKVVVAAAGGGGGGDDDGKRRRRRRISDVETKTAVASIIAAGTDAAESKEKQQEEEEKDKVVVVNPDYFVCERIFYLDRGETTYVSVGYNTNCRHGLNLCVKLRSVTKRSRVVFDCDEWCTFVALYVPLMEGFFKGDESFDLKFGRGGDLRLKTGTVALAKGAEKRISLCVRNERNPFCLNFELWSNLRIILPSVCRQLEASNARGPRVSKYYEEYGLRCRELDRRPLLEYFEPTFRNASDVDDYDDVSYDSLFYEFTLLDRKLFDV